MLARYTKSPNLKNFLYILLIISVGIFLLRSYKSKPVFSPPIHQTGVFQDPEQINLKIQPVLLSKYKYQNSNSFHQTSFQQNPAAQSAIHFTNKYSNLSFFTNSIQSFGTVNEKVKPTTQNNTITYKSIFPNTDLKYTVNPNQLLEEFIVYDKNTALKMIEISQTLDRSNIDSYQEMDNGSIKLFYQENLVATIPIPVMYELKDKAIKSYDLKYEVKELDKDTLSITKVINQEGQDWLNDKKRIYPIVIDLVIDNADNAASWISSDPISSVVSQETTIKQEGTGSIKIDTTAESTSTTDLMEYSSDSTAQTAYINESTSNTATATGGTITNVGGFRIHTFTSSGTFTPNGSMNNVEVLVVGGGGGGSSSPWGGGGGGAGGVLYKTNHSLSTATTVTVGAGGGAGATGAHSYFGSLQAFGGGKAGTSQTASTRNGGSGGGAGHMNPAGAASATTQTSNNGGTGYGRNGGASTYGGTYPCGSGGGATNAGSSGGTGGLGRAFSISGSSKYYAGGGGQSSSTGGATAGGTGGGGAGNSTGNGGNGTAYTGGGGGGSKGGTGGSGGKGVVIIRYPLSTSLPIGGTITTNGNYRIHKYTSASKDIFYNPNNSLNIEVLLIGGGGGGTGSPWGGGGGGAGGVLYKAVHAVGTGTTGVTVGIGGTQTLPGVHSYFGSLLAYGGGRANTNQTESVRNGGSGGGAGHMNPAGGVSASTQTSNNGGTGYGNGGGGSIYSGVIPCGSGGGAGGAGTTGGVGGAGRAFSITGSSIYYAGGGGQSTNSGGATAGGTGGGGTGNYSGNGGNGTANKGGGGGGSKGGSGGSGGSGVVIIRYLKPMLSYSESTIKTQGSYSLKGIATTASLNKTLTRTISPTLNLTSHNTINFDLRSSRTGSNIKIAIHDSGGTTTEITPNITSAGVFQSFDFDISGVSDSNKDNIDKIIITIVNASAVNTFYIDNITSVASSLNNTISLSKSATDLTGSAISFWIRSDTSGSFTRFQFGEIINSEQTYDFTINSANTWEQKTWDLSSIPAGDRNEVTEFAFKFTSDTSGAILYFDDIQVGAPPPTPTPTPVPLEILNGESNGANSCYLEESPHDDEIIIHWTDGATDEIGYEIERLDNSISWSTIDITSPNAESYADSSVVTGNNYRYRIRKRTDDSGTGEWCGTPQVSIKDGNFQMEGLQLEGIKLD